MWRLTCGPGASLLPRVVRPTRTFPPALVRKKGCSRTCGASQTWRGIEILLWCPYAAGAYAQLMGSGQPDIAMAGLPQEVLLEREFHRVCLRPGDQNSVLARREHLVGQDDHA